MVKLKVRFKTISCDTYIFTNLPRNAIVRLSHPQRGDNHGRERFLSPAMPKI